VPSPPARASPFFVASTPRRDMLHPWAWVGFNLFVLLVLAIDLGVFHRRAHAVSFREAAAWTAVWVALALAFCAALQQTLGNGPALEFLTGYLIEKALSVDNLFVFVLIFTYFSVPARYQHRILFWGILGALVLRGVMIASGAALVDRFHWILYVFGAFLLFTGIRMARGGDAEIDPRGNPVLRMLRRWIPVTAEYHGAAFFVRERRERPGRWMATPLFVVLVVVETTDVVFAVDSIPAIFAVTRDPFLVYTSNVFAILGLRAMYFLLAGVVHRFHLLRLGLSAVLVFIGGKMLVAAVGWHVPVGVSLGVVAALLGASIAASLLFPRVESAPPAPGPLPAAGAPPAPL
jgi:tellurite resistance protein TerC